MGILWDILDVGFGNCDIQKGYTGLERKASYVMGVGVRERRSNIQIIPTTVVSPVETLNRPKSRAFGVCPEIEKPFLSKGIAISMSN